ncbi:DUF6817 domain-containing protein [Cupriavidus basilensis]
MSLAGAFHSVYGTEEFAARALPLTGHGKIAALLGTEAERLVYFFCVADRRKVLRCAGRGPVSYRPRRMKPCLPPDGRQTPSRDAKRAVKVYQAVWGASSAGKKSGKEGAMFEYRLKAMRVWPPAALFVCRRGGVAPSGALFCLLFWQDKKVGRRPAGVVKLPLTFKLLTLALSSCSA